MKPVMSHDRNHGVTPPGFIALTYASLNLFGARGLALRPEFRFPFALEVS